MIGWPPASPVTDADARDSSQMNSNSACDWVAGSYFSAMETCKLILHLLAAPPSGDILLIGGPKKCQGEFTDLPEGGAVRAEFVHPGPAASTKSPLDRR